MRHLVFLFLAVCFCFASFAQRVQSGNFSTIYQIDKDGKIQDASFRTVGYIRDGRVQDASFRTIGHLRKGTVQDASFRTLGSIDENGRVQDASFRTLGTIDEQGRVQDAQFRTIGYAKGIDREWAALVFFFFKFEQ